MTSKPEECVHCGYDKFSHTVIGDFCWHGKSTYTPKLHQPVTTKTVREVKRLYQGYVKEEDYDTALRELQRLREENRKLIDRLSRFEFPDTSGQ